MKKTILNLGNALNKKQLKEINGGMRPVAFCEADGSCPRGTYCQGGLCYNNNDGGPGGGGPGGDGCTNPTAFCIDEFDTCCIY